MDCDVFFLVEFASTENWRKDLILLANDYAETMKEYFKKFKALYQEKDSEFRS